METIPFELPPYPYDRLDQLKQYENRFVVGGLVNLSVGTPVDAPPSFISKILGSSSTQRSYPNSIGSPSYRQAASDWMERRFNISIPISTIAACVGTKEFVASVPSYLRLRYPDKDTVLYPEVSYPTYAMGAMLARCRAVPVRMHKNWTIDVSSIDPADAKRALCLWVNSPGNPAGGMDDLEQIVAWGKAHNVPIFSDECYSEFTWDRSPQTILSFGLENVVSVHSLSKRSNLAGIRAGFYAGDKDIVYFLSEVRKHSGLMIPGPVQEAAIAAYDDDIHVEQQRKIYWDRLQRCKDFFTQIGCDVSLPSGAFYLWIKVPEVSIFTPGNSNTEGDDGASDAQIIHLDATWEFVHQLAKNLGIIVSPGEFYGSSGEAYFRVAVVATDAQLDLIEDRIAAFLTV